MVGSWIGVNSSEYWVLVVLFPFFLFLLFVEGKSLLWTSGKDRADILAYEGDHNSQREHLSV